jgi:hypothetical protein
MDGVISCVHIVDYFYQIWNLVDLDFEILLKKARFEVIVLETFRPQRLPAGFDWVLSLVLVIQDFFSLKTFVFLRDVAQSDTWKDVIL